MSDTSNFIKVEEVWGCIWDWDIKGARGRKNRKIVIRVRFSQWLQERRPLRFHIINSQFLF